MKGTTSEDKCNKISDKIKKYYGKRSKTNY